VNAPTAVGTKGEGFVGAELGTGLTDGDGLDAGLVDRIAVAVGAAWLGAAAELHAIAIAIGATNNKGAKTRRAFIAGSLQQEFRLRSRAYLPCQIKRAKPVNRQTAISSRRTHAEAVARLQETARGAC
jgi:hypothetical protein